MSGADELERLSATIGIDLNALKEKYSVAQKQQGGSSVTTTEACEAHEKLENYNLCKGCMGSGLMTVVYNHISTQKNCIECGGEGILEKLELRVKKIASNIASAAVPQAESAYDVSLTLPPQVFTASTATANSTVSAPEA